MRFFTMLVDPNDKGLWDDARRAYEALVWRCGMQVEWRSFEHAAVLTAWDDPYGDPLTSREGAWIAPSVRFQALSVGGPREATQSATTRRLHVPARNSALSLMRVVARCNQDYAQGCWVEKDTGSH